MTATHEQSAPAASVHQKARLTAGTDMWTVPGEPDLGLLPITVSDGPNGVRGSRMDERFSGYCTPCGTSLAATWDVALVDSIGELVARDAHRKGVQVVLGPTVNLHRSPLGGRGFECFSEDPHLTTAIAVAWVRALQRLGVAATRSTSSPTTQRPRGAPWTPSSISALCASCTCGPSRH